MKDLLSVGRHFLILGKGRQNFLGASWVLWVLRMCPRRFKRPVALRVLALSPHYFYRHVNPEYEHMSKRQFLEAEFERNRGTRAVICDQILGRHLRGESRVLDVGCGPGFLAQHVSRRVRQVYAADISKGVLECARVLNGASNILYLESSDEGYLRIDDGSLDFVYSFAVIQHVTDQIFAELLRVVSIKLRPGGQALFHIVLEDEPGGSWKSESDWVSDRSLRGRVKFKYGLNCFCRSRDDVVRMLDEARFTTKQIVRAGDVAPEVESDIASEHLVLFEKPLVTARNAV